MAGVHGHAVGVDFGTSTSLVAVRAGRRPVEIIPLGRTTRWFPSVAGYRDDTLLVGEDADALPGDGVIRSIKRAITHNRDAIQLPGGRDGEVVSADTVITALLAEIAERAATAGEPLSAERELRLGCPAIWNGAQRRRLLELAGKAGLPIDDDSSMVDEPIAAGVAWVTDRFLTHNERPEGRLLVFDMGGGTLDIAVLDVVGGPNPEISVMAALGSDVAGDDLDRTIAAELLDDLTGRGFTAESSPHPELFQALVLRAARDAKVALSRLREHRVVLPRQVGQLPVLTYARERLEEAFRGQMDTAEQLVWAALRAARMTERDARSPAELRALGPEQLSSDIRYVLLAGGMSRIPYVERRIGALFPRAEIFDSAGVESDEAIVAGLADTAGYQRLNLHRPGFDFLVEWEEGGQVRQELLYPAYTPFYEPWQVLSGQSNLGYERHGRDFPGPGRGTGRLVVRSTGGERLPITYDGRPMDGVELVFGDKMTFKLYCDGQVLLRQPGKTLRMRVDRWPVIRGRDHAALVLRSAEGPTATPPTPWYLEKEWAPPR